MKQLFSRNGTAGSKGWWSIADRRTDQWTGVSPAYCLESAPKPTPGEEEAKQSREDSCRHGVESPGGAGPWGGEGCTDRGLRGQRVPLKYPAECWQARACEKQLLWGGGETSKRVHRNSAWHPHGAKRTAYSQQPDWEILGRRRVNYPNWTWRVTLTMHSALGACNTIKKWWNTDASRPW